MCSTFIAQFFNRVDKFTALECEKAAIRPLKLEHFVIFVRTNDRQARCRVNLEAPQVDLHHHLALTHQ